MFGLTDAQREYAAAIRGLARELAGFTGVEGEVNRPLLQELGAGAPTYRSTSRRDRTAAMNASPLATARTAKTSCSRGTSLSRNPLAPARIAS